MPSALVSCHYGIKGKLFVAGTSFFGYERTHRALIISRFGPIAYVLCSLGFFV